MILSMTAFARSEHRMTLGTLICELRSVNHRYLDINLHLPEALRFTEMTIRETLRHEMKRGKVDCAIKFQPVAQSQSLLTWNQEFAHDLIQLAESVAKLAKAPAPINPLDILKFPGIMTTAELDQDIMLNAITTTLSLAMQEFLHTRRREGAEIKQMLLEKVLNIHAQLVLIEAHLPNVIQGAKERLLTRFEEATLTLDAHRLEHEMLLFAHKIDVTEEVERLQAHLLELQRVIEVGGAVGRRIDFLLQELNRETNTLASKILDVQIAKASIEIKVLIEQIREQAQNVE